MKKRKLLKSGNQANLVCIPKEFVERNNLKGKQDLFIKDLGRSFIVEIDPPKDRKIKSLVLKNASKDEILLKLKALYRLGESDFTLTLPDNEDLISSIENEITSLWGIRYIRDKNNISIYSEKHENDCVSILKKCFEEILHISVHLTQYVNDSSWYDVLEIGYNKVISRLNFTCRILNTGTSKNIKSALRYHSMIMILQIIARSLGRIAKQLKYSKPACSLLDLQQLLRTAYNVCFNCININNLFEIIAEIRTCQKGVIVGCVVKLILLEVNVKSC